MPWGAPLESSREDGGSLASPFVDEQLAGYERWKPYDQFGSWYLMLQPGARGNGLHLGHLLEPECCVGYFGATWRTTAVSSQNNPWLLPSTVSWASIMGLDGKPLAPFIENFDVDYPCVAITAVNTSQSEFRWFLDNVNIEYDCDRYDYEPSGNLLWLDGYSVPILGIVPIWTVMPVSERYLHEINTSISFLQQKTNWELLGECWCTAEWIECEDDCANRSDSRAECTCNSRETFLEELEGIWTATQDPRQHMTTECAQIYTEGITNLYNGWQVIHDAQEQGEQWASYWWQRQSPFSASPGLNAKMTSEWTDLTSSETQQAS